MTAELERDVSIVVKTFERPDSLGRLVRSVRRFYPRIPILVVDDSAAPIEPTPDGVTRYWHLPFNSLGIAGGRNFGLRQVETSYVLFCDDDMVFGRRTDLGKMLRTLETTRFDVVSCKWMDHVPGTSVRLGVKRLEGTAEIADGTLVRRLGVARGTVDGLPVFDVVHQFFVVERERLGEDPWDARLNLVEHSDFFLTLKERGFLCTRLPDVVVYHYPQLPPDYRDVRTRRAPYFELFRQKRGFERRIFVGRWFSRRDRLIHHYPSATAYGVRRALRMG
jgi:glycosyltransferase involved in cell wall biosynthesis